MKTTYFAWLAGISLLALGACSDGSSTTRDSEQENVTPTALKTETLFVASSRVSCIGVAPQQCLLVRKMGEQQWQYFYDSIVGFEYEEGYLWELAVKRTAIANPPADGSSERVELVRVLNKTADPAADMGEIEDIEVAADAGECASFVGFRYACLQIRTLGSEDWSLWPGEIEGYEHNDGVSTILRVQNVAWDLQAPMDDAPPFRRVLIAVLSSQGN